MYEKPQYLTPDGYKRAASNPLKGRARPVAPAKKPVVGGAAGAAPLVNLRKGKGLSPEAAKAVAQAISAMLKS